MLIGSFDEKETLIITLYSCFMFNITFCLRIHPHSHIFKQYLKKVLMYLIKYFNHGGPFTNTFNYFSAASYKKRLSFIRDVISLTVGFI